MRVQARGFWLPKDPGYAVEYEDACALDLDRGRAAIADGDPWTIAGAPRAADQFLEFGSAEGAAHAGDWLMLTTDALLGWALRNYEAGLPPDWDEMWNLSDDDFAAREAGWRDTRAIRADDTTLMLLQVSDDIVEPAPDAEMDDTDD